METAEVKKRELADQKSSFDGLALELQYSRTRMQELEHEVEHFIGEAHSFEERLKQFSSQAQFEGQRALQYEKLIEDAKLSSRLMEDQIASLENEVEDLYDKILEHEKVQETLKTTAAQLAVVQKDMEHSKSQVLELEQTLASKETLINELTREMELTRASESKVKDDLLALEDLYTSTRDDIKRKVAELENIERKLQQETSVRDSVEAKLKLEEESKSVLQEELAKEMDRKRELELTVDDLKTNINQMKEVCFHLENKLKVLDGNFCQADSKLSQALSRNAQLQMNLNRLEDLHRESETEAKSATKKNIELEEIIRASNTTAEEANSQLTEIRASFKDVCQRNMELEEQLSHLQVQKNNSDREMRELSEEASELKAMLHNLGADKVKLDDQIQEYLHQIDVLKSFLHQSSLHNAELENKLKTIIEKCAEHEKQANLTHQHSLELEHLIKTSQSKLDDSEKRVNELRLLLENEKHRIQELVDQRSLMEKKCADIEADAKKYFDKMSQLTSELETCQARSSDLEVSLQQANEREMELLKSLNASTDKERQLKEAFEESILKLIEAENLLEVFRNELPSAQENFRSAEMDLKAARKRESEISLKLSFAEEEAEKQKLELEQIVGELESQYESLKRDSEAKLREAATSLNQKDSETKSLLEKVHLLQEQVESYREQVVQMNTRFESSTKESEETLAKLASLEATSEELKEKVLEEEKKSELLVETNNQLRRKNDDLQELLKSTNSTKEVTAQQVTSKTESIAELTEEHLRDIIIQSVNDTRALEAEKQLQEVIQKNGQKESENKELNEKPVPQDQLKSEEEQRLKASSIAEIQENATGESLTKVRHVESIMAELQTKCSQYENENSQLGDQNVKFTQEKQMYESQIKDLQQKLSAALTQKDETIRLVENQIPQFSPEREGQESKASSAMEEINFPKEVTHKEPESDRTQLKEHEPNKEVSSITELEHLKDQTEEKSALQIRLKELEQELQIAQRSINAKKEEDLQKENEHSAVVSKLLDELEAKRSEVENLQKQVKDINLKQRQAEDSSTKKDDNSVADQEVGAKKESKDLESKRKRKILSYIPVCGGIK